MNVACLLQVNGDKVVEEGLGAREGEETRLGLEALDSGNIGSSVGLGEGSPGCSVSGSSFYGEVLRRGHRPFPADSPVAFVALASLAAHLLRGDGIGVGRCHLVERRESLPLIDISGRKVRLLGNSGKSCTQ